MQEKVNVSYCCLKVSPSSELLLQRWQVSGLQIISRLVPVKIIVLSNLLLVGHNPFLAGQNIHYIIACSRLSDSGGEEGSHSFLFALSILARSLEQANYMIAPQQSLPYPTLPRKMFTYRPSALFDAFVAYATLNCPDIEAFDRTKPIMDWTCPLFGRYFGCQSFICQVDC